MAAPQHKTGPPVYKDASAPIVTTHKMLRTQILTNTTLGDSNLLGSPVGSYCEMIRSSPLWPDPGLC